MQTLKQTAIAVIGAFALFGLGTGFAAAADVPAQPEVPQQNAAPPPAPRTVVKRVYRYAPRPVVYVRPAVAYRYTRVVVASPYVYPRPYVAGYGIYPRRYAAGYGFRAYPRYAGGYGRHVARVHHRHRWY